MPIDILLLTCLSSLYCENLSIPLMGVVSSDLVRYKPGRFSFPTNQIVGPFSLASFLPFARLFEPLGLLDTCSAPLWRGL